MAEVIAPDNVDPTTVAAETAVDMDVENAEAGDNSGEPKQKRTREEGEGEPQGEEKEDEVASKKTKAEEEKSVEEQRLVKLEEQQGAEGEEEKTKELCEPVKLGPKSFGSSLEMFNYFLNLLQVWPHYLDINKYEHLVLLELLKKGHAEPDKKIGGGIRAFQVRKHATFKSRCFFLIREDGSVDDFSFRKCVDHILPLPEETYLKPDQNKALGGGGGGGGGGGKHHGGKGGRGRGGKGGHGRGRKWRN